MENLNEKKEIARNEPCPCGSGKKYKRCCGVSAQPKLGAPKAAWPPAEGLGASRSAGMGAGAEMPPGMTMPAMPPGMPEMDPEMMMQLSQALTRLPKGQMQRLQALVQKAMAGKDVTREAQELERSLPPDFQSLMTSFKAKAEASQAAGSLPVPAALEAPTATMTEDEARRVVEAAVAAGKLKPEEAANLLAASNAGASSNESLEEKAGSSISKLWRNFTGK